MVFAETGLLVGFFLPGDSLLVTAGLFCTSANGEAPLLNIVTLDPGGDRGGDRRRHRRLLDRRQVRPRIFSREQSLFFSRKHLLRTKEFYERHGGKTIIMARFMPFLRTFAPVVAGVGQMNYRRFVSFNIFGGIAWVASMTMLGYSLGSIYPGITKQIDKVVVVIIVVSLIPGTISYLMNRKKTPPSASLAA